MIPVRLCDIALDVRLAAARRLARLESDQGALLDLLQAAANPSSSVYWISDEAAKGLDFLISAGTPDTVISTGVLDNPGCSQDLATPKTDFREAA